jgi:septal ring factor EnvC (AmiA/AmiB activator)
MNSKKINNEIEKSINSNKELKIKSQRLNDGISDAKQGCNELKANIYVLTSDNNNSNTQINNEKVNCNNL